MNIKASRINDEHPVYPGHPVTLALLVMQIYPNFLAATKKSGVSGFEAALADTRIPGGGGEVCTALDLLRRIAGGMQIDDAIRWGDERWANNNAGGHINSVEPGQNQANARKDTFRKQATIWDFSS